MKNMRAKILAPIALFCYNRPEHVRKTLYALSQNSLVECSELYIFCDGPKSKATPYDVTKISEVRRIVREKRWCETVHIVESDSNKGLADSIIGGVTDVVNRYGKVIVLEDDLITSPCFLKFMNDALDFYQGYPAVFSISGFNFSPSVLQIPDDYDYDTFVSLRAMSWGWATWRDKWNIVDWSMDNMNLFTSKAYQTSAFDRCGDDVTRMLKMQYSGQIDSWAIRFCFAHFFNHAVAILPVQSFVKNIGLDGSGTHCYNCTEKEEFPLCSKESFKMLDVIYEDSRMINSFYNVYCGRKRPLWQRACNFIMRTIGRKPPFVIKKKIYV